MNLETSLQLFQLHVLPVLLRLLGALLIWNIGRRLIAVVATLVGRTLTHNKLDATLVRYLTSILSGLLTVFLVLGIVEFLGIPTTSFAALAAGAGLAIGAAWSGMLANFAAGIFMIVMRPFKVGDEITAGGVTGRVKEIGLFATQIDTEDKIQTLVGNAKLFGDNLQNHTGYAVRTCKVEFYLRSNADFQPHMETLEEALKRIRSVEAASCEVEFEKFSPWGPVLSATVDCPHGEFRRVRADMAAAIQHVYGNMGLAAAPAPASA